MNSDNFKFYLPADILKATDINGQEKMTFKGIASTSDKDSQGEFLDPSGFDLSSFQWINWNHKGKDDPSTIIGEPTLAKITPNNELYIEGVLYDDVPMAKSTFALMKALNNSPNGNKLSLSVEGKVIQRGSENEKDPLYKKILKSKITAVAICPVPVNANTWVDLQKGVLSNDLEKEEQYDEETEKAIQAADSVIVKEDVETKKNHAQENSLVKEALKKSDVYDIIFKNYPSISIEDAKSVYSLIEKSTTMSTENKTVSSETISKAFEILNLASEELSKAAKQEEKQEVKEKEEEEEDNEMTEKAYCQAKEMKKAGDAKEAIQAKLLKKGYGETVVSKAIEKAMADKEEEDDDDDLKKDVKKSFDSLEALIKSQSEAYDAKFKALGEVLLAQKVENEELKKSLDESLNKSEELSKEIKTILSTPMQRKSVGSRSFSERFEKSEDGKSVYNINNASDRKNLRVKLEDLSGINKGENYDSGLIKIAQDIELTKSIDHKDVIRLDGLGIKVVNQ